MARRTGLTFDAVADELYTLPPEQFTAARNDREKQAREAGDPALAQQIRALGKPNLAAWLSNQMAREHRDELQPLLELGASMREATRRLAGDQLRQLSRQQHELIYALVQQARQLGASSGRPVSDAVARGVEETLHAAMADQDAAARVLAGRLTTGLQYSGFGDVGDAGPPPTGRAGKNAGGAAAKGPPSKGPPSKRPPSKANGEVQRAARRAAQRAVREAERAVAVATKSRDAAEAAATEAEAEAKAAQARVDRLRHDLEQAGVEASEAVSRRRKRADALRQAERELRDAQRQLAAAEDSREAAD